MCAIYFRDRTFFVLVLLEVDLSTSAILRSNHPVSCLKDDRRRTSCRIYKLRLSWSCFRFSCRSKSKYVHLWSQKLVAEEGTPFSETHSVHRPRPKLFQILLDFGHFHLVHISSYTFFTRCVLFTGKVLEQTDWAVDVVAKPTEPLHEHRDWWTLDV